MQCCFKERCGKRIQPSPRSCNYTVRFTVILETIYGALTPGLHACFAFIRPWTNVYSYDALDIGALTPGLHACLKPWTYVYRYDPLDIGALIPGQHACLLFKVPDICLELSLGSCIQLPRLVAYNCVCAYSPFTTRN